MNITNVKYRLDDDGKNCQVKATIDGEEMFVPLDPANRHYAAILEWAKEDGNTIQEAD